MRPVVVLVVHLQEAVCLGGTGLVLGSRRFFERLLAGLAVRGRPLKSDNLFLGFSVFMQLPLQVFDSRSEDL